MLNIKKIKIPCLNIVTRVFFHNVINLTNNFTDVNFSIILFTTTRLNTDQLMNKVFMEKLPCITKKQL